MKVYRNVEIKTEEIQVGDVIRFSLKNGENGEAMAVEKQTDGMVFCFVDCLEKEYPMNKRNTTAGGYENSLLRKVLNSEILDLFPDDLREKMIPFANGDLLKIPSEKEMFGKNVYSDEPEDCDQWEPMKDRRNRIAYQGSRTGTLEWTWLRDVVCASGFAGVYATGGSASTYASSSLGVRPAFGIKA